jgi:hypothetical protein
MHKVVLYRADVSRIFLGKHSTEATTSVGMQVNLYKASKVVLRRYLR